MAPQPRETPARPPIRPTAEPGQEAVDETLAGHRPSGAYEVEPTTGAPVDALPRRVPIRQHGRADDRTGEEDTPTGEDDPWLPIEEVHWDGTPIADDVPTTAARRWWGRRADRRCRSARQRDPLPGLAALLGLSLLAAFFAWVSAEPFWLAVGHRTAGSVVVGDCTGGGLTQRCRGTFTAGRGEFVAHGVRVSGLTDGGEATGSALRAYMTGPTGRSAYVDTRGGWHLRWLLGFGLILVCAAGIARTTGTAGLSGRGTRHLAVAAAFGGPVLVTLGFLAAAF